MGCDRRSLARGEDGWLCTMGYADVPQAAFAMLWNGKYRR